MSGIAGIFYTDDKPVERVHLADMLGELAHRGPDAQSIWCQGSVGLGCCVLRTTTGSFSEQIPQDCEQSGLALTADARIDNRSELIDTLAIDDQHAADSELILRAYQRWGEACTQRLLGDFSFAIWDQQRQRLFCARDHLGIKPLYYHQAPGMFAFASEIKALLALAVVPRRLNEVRLADYLAGFLDDHSVTFYEDILRLPAAHSASINRKGMSLWRYWILDPHRTLQHQGDRAYAEAFAEILTQAVDCRLRRADPVGFELSGGLDSSSILCTAQQLLTGQPLNTFSVVFDQAPGAVEHKYIKAVHRGGGRFQPRYVYYDREPPLAQLDHILRHHDEPVSLPNIHWGVYRAASNQGIRVLLDGIDGDTVLWHGLDGLTDLIRAAAWSLSLGEIRGWCRRLFCGGRRPVADHQVINSDFAHRIDLKTRLRAVTAEGCSSLPHWRLRHCRRLTSVGVTRALAQVDATAAAFALELRHPFFDKRVLEMAVALPLDQRFQRGWTRVVLRRAMEEILPAEIIHRQSKGYFGPNVVRGMHFFESGFLDNLILGGPRTVDQYVNMALIRELYARSKSSDRLSDTALVWDVASLGLWLEGAGIGG